MEESGQLSREQAALLRDSLGRRGPAAAPPTRRRRPTWLALLALFALVVLFGFALFGGGSGPQEVQDVAQTLNQPGGQGAMNRPLSIVLAVALLLVVPLLLWVWLHNDLVRREEAVFAAWAQTESNFQRRADLIPALVETLSRYLRHESETLTAVTAERAKAAAAMSGAVDTLLQANKEAVDLLREHGREIVERDDALASLFAAQTAVGQKVQGLLAIAEDYPDLRSADQFLELQAQIEGTENRINVARMRFNEAVRDYNAAIRRLPGSLVAGVGNFRRKAYFQADEAAADAPELRFQ
jgi:LemA protein